jgi:3-deoxy-D-manno-octulosonate 8-phosphate phosphatase (KDO 8-P phosphatase)
MTTEQLKKIRLLLLDVDGVLTDGSIVYDDQGTEIKSFNAKDGLGIRLLMQAGIQIGIITGRTSAALRHRCKNLGIDHLYEAVGDKTEALQDILQRTAVKAENTAFMGDDLPDLPIMKRVGLAITVADAPQELRDAADITTVAAGGRGAVREICETILKTQAHWDQILLRYTT